MLQNKIIHFKKKEFVTTLIHMKIVELLLGLFMEKSTFDIKYNFSATKLYLSITKVIL